MEWYDSGGKSEENPRPPLSHPCLRHRDEDLLPFPLTDTINAEESRKILGEVLYRTFGKLVEEGRFWAYRFYRDTAWRVSRSSLENFARRVSRSSLENFARRVRNSENVKGGRAMYRALPVEP